MSKARIGAAGVVLLVVLGAAFWFLDLRAASSETQAHSQWSTISLGQGEPTSAANGVTLYLAVSGGMSEDLAAGLARSLQSSPGVGRIDQVASLPDQAHRPSLVVEVTGTEGVWTPVYARRTLAVHASYASNGDLSWRGGPIVASNQDGPAILLDGRVELIDVTRGLVSRRAYERYLGEQVGGEVGKMLAQAHPPVQAGGPAGLLTFRNVARNLAVQEYRGQVAGVGRPGHSPQAEEVPADVRR